MTIQQRNIILHALRPDPMNPTIRKNKFVISRRSSGMPVLRELEEKGFVVENTDFDSDKYAVFHVTEAGRKEVKNEAGV